MRVRVTIHDPESRENIESDIDIDLNEAVREYAARVALAQFKTIYGLVAPHAFVTDTVIIESVEYRRKTYNPDRLM